MEVTREARAAAEGRMAVAHEILMQMGGHRRLTLMAGCKDFVAIDNGVQFSVGQNAKGVNKVRVILTPQDLYDVEFGRVRRVKGVPTYTVLSKSEGIYNDMLKREFEEATGMYLTM
jgi:hypothetical protein